MADPFGRTRFIIRVAEHYDELWTKLTTGVDTRLIGDVLFNHMIIEFYLTEYLKVTLPEEFDIEAAGLGYAKKVDLLGKDPFMADNGMREGVLAVNAIRNTYAHHLDRPIEAKHLKTLIKVIKEARRNRQNPCPRFPTHPANFAIFRFIRGGDFFGAHVGTCQGSKDSGAD